MTLKSSYMLAWLKPDVEHLSVLAEDLVFASRWRHQLNHLFLAIKFQGHLGSVCEVFWSSSWFAVSLEKSEGAYAARLEILLWTLPWKGGHLNSALLWSFLLL